MSLLRAIVAAAVIVAAVPAHAQSAQESRRPVHREVAEVRTTFGGYSGVLGRFLYGPPRLLWPVARPRTVWVEDDLAPEARPLGFSASAYGYSTYSRPEPGWLGWPYVSTGGRDEAPVTSSGPRAEAEAAVQEGRARWRAGNASGALDSFKRAVAADLKYGPAQLHMALALLAAGDGRNADKAVASALDLVRAPEELAALKLDDLFRATKDRTKFESKIAPAADGSGTLASALAHHLLGLKARAAALLERLNNDARAKRLAELIQ